jgi:hypothetical protein
VEEIRKRAATRDHCGVELEAKKLDNHGCWWWMLWWVLGTGATLHGISADCQPT